MKPLNQGTHFLNLKLAWAFFNGLQLPISAAAYSTTGQQINSNPPSSCASPRHAACLEMDVLRRGAEVIPAGYLKGEVPGDCQITAIKRVLKGFSHQGFWITWYSYHIQHREAEYKTRHFGRKNTAERRHELTFQDNYGIIDELRYVKERRDVGNCSIKCCSRRWGLHLNAEVRCLVKFSHLDWFFWPRFTDWPQTVLQSEH